jgi:TPR repeat protein
MEPASNEAILNAAKSGDPAAQFEMGLMHEHGINAAKDLKAAARWYSSAADGGHAQAAYKLSNLYQMGIDEPPDMIKRNHWLRRACELGLPEAQYKLASLLEKGLDIDQDAAQAAKWYREAAKHGIQAAQVKAGIMYMEGMGVKRDYKEAARLFKEAADKGNPDAQYHLAVLYTTGSGVEQDTAQAFRLFQMAAEAGQAQAKEKFSGIRSGGAPEPAPQSGRKGKPQPVPNAPRDESMQEIFRSSFKPAGACSLVISVLLFTPIGDVLNSGMKSAGWVVMTIIGVIFVIGALAALKFFSQGRQQKVPWEAIGAVCVVILIVSLGFSALTMSGFKFQDPNQQQQPAKQLHLMHEPDEQ